MARTLTWPAWRSRKVLYLGANPPGTAQLALDDEVRTIRLELRAAWHRCLELSSCCGTEPNDLIRELLALMPVIVHLSCHGCKPCVRSPSTVDGAHRDVAGDRASDAERDGGLVFHARNGSVQVVPYELVSKIFEIAGTSVKLVVLTACATEPLARRLLAHVPCAIGVDGPLGDQAALEFSRGFYAAIVDGASVAQAYEAGRVAIQVAELPGADRVKLWVRDEINAGQIVLAATPRTRMAGPRRHPGRSPSRTGKRGARRGKPRSAARRRAGR